MTKEKRFSIHEFYAWWTKVEVLASFSLARPEDSFDIGLFAARGDAQAMAALDSMNSPVTACVFIDSASTAALLAALDQKRIAAAVVSNSSCRAGNPRSLLNNGQISAVNELAFRFGGQIGQSTREFTEKMVRARETRIRGWQTRAHSAMAAS